MRSLIGTSSWNPIGESMWSIGAKLTRLNHLNWVEVRRLLGSKDLKSFNDKPAQCPDDLHNFQLPRLAVSTGWSLDVFAASFTQSYQPAWVNDAHTRSVEEPYRPLRGCHACFAEGAHLIVHQIPEFTHCPIHQVLLTSECPKCRGWLGQFRVSAPFDHPGICRHCSNPFLRKEKQSKSYFERRAQMVSEFHGWLSKIDVTFNRNASRYQWIDGPPELRHLAHIHQLVPGPPWLDSCFFNAKSVKVTNWSWSGSPLDRGRQARAHRIPAEPERLLYDRGLWPKPLPSTVDDYVRLFAVEVQRHLGRVANLFRASFDSEGIYQLNASSCALNFGSDVSTWNTGFWLWRRSLDEAFPHGHRWARTRNHLPMLYSWVWSEWVRTVGHLLWFPKRDLTRPFNSEFVKWLTRIWLARLCEESYCQFVGVACRDIGSYWLNMHSLSTRLINVGDPSIWLLEEGGDGISQVRALSTTENIREFRKLRDSGFGGTDDKYCEAFEKFQPLLKLLRTHPTAAKEWEWQWREVRRRHQARKRV